MFVQWNAVAQQISNKSPDHMVQPAMLDIVKACMPEIARD